MSLYLYLHVYKAAGMTVRRLLRQWFSRPEYDEIDTPDWKTGLERVKTAPESYFKAKKCLFGHLWYGWHTLVPRPCQYIALLRDPVERILSFYWYHRTTPTHPDHEVALSLPLGDYVRQRRPVWIDNGQVRQIAGLLDESGKHLVRSGGIGREHLERAKLNLQQHFAFVGLQQRFPEAVVAIADLFAKPVESYSTRNKTRIKPDRSSLTQSEREAIAEVNQYDSELYCFAKDLYYDRFHTPTLQRRARYVEARSGRENSSEGDSIYSYQ